MTSRLAAPVRPGKTSELDERDRIEAAHRSPVPSPGHAPHVSAALELQRTASNAAVVQLLRGSLRAAPVIQRFWGDDEEEASEGGSSWWPFGGDEAQVATRAPRGTGPSQSEAPAPEPTQSEYGPPEPNQSVAEPEPAPATQGAGSSWSGGGEPATEPAAGRGGGSGGGSSWWPWGSSEEEPAAGGGGGSGGEPAAGQDAEHSPDEMASKDAEGYVGRPDVYVPTAGGPPPYATPAATGGFHDMGRVATVPFGTVAPHDTLDPEEASHPHAYTGGGQSGTVAWSGGGPAADPRATRARAASRRRSSRSTTTGATGRSPTPTPGSPPARASPT